VLTPRVPIARDLVLAGGGHSHAIVARMLGMRGLPPGVRVTLVSASSLAPYSGMLPGRVAGLYGDADMHIDLRRLAAFAGIRFVQATITGVDAENRRLLLDGRPPLAFDVLSINTGSTPVRSTVPGAERFATAVKPVAGFLAAVEDLARLRAEAPSRRLRLAIVGGGAGGCELALALARRLGGPIAVRLIESAPTVLPTYAAAAQRRMREALAERGVELHLGQRVARVDADELVTEAGLRIDFDRLFWVTVAGPPPWLATSGLALADDGFIDVDACLRSTSHPYVFAAGDVATMPAAPRPKAGVFAVRQGPILAKNLAAAAEGPAARLVPYRPQKRFLTIMNLCDGSALFVRAPLIARGAWAWRLKDWIDRRFMRRFAELPAMTPAPLGLPAGASQELTRLAREAAMRCKGCGAKVESGALGRALEACARPGTAPGVVLGLDARDDVAAWQPPADRLLLQSVDFIPAMLDDPYLFGRIAAAHALSDVFAKGGEAHSALLACTVPFQATRPLEAELSQLMAGVRAALDEAGAALLGGHTAEGAELGVGLTVNGLVDPERLLRKGGARPGDVLVLTKALGTGVILAAHQKACAPAAAVDAAVAGMTRLSRGAARILVEHGATACTDVTGFGLAGHAREMAVASRVDLTLQVARLPVLTGAEALLAAGFRSSLAAANRAGARAEGLDAELVFDPQTSGGLLATIPAERAAACVRALRAAGDADSAIIGAAAPVKQGAEPCVRLS
jgi:selenide,water dikinase